MGAIVLIIFACILVPVVFHNSSIHSLKVAMNPLIPAEPQPLSPMPEVSKEQALMQKQHQVISQAQLDKDRAQALKYFAKSQKLYWYVQLASFNDRKHAAKLIEQLKNKHILPIDSSKITLKKSKYFKVMVGPFSQKAKAQAVLEEAQKQVHLKGILLEAKL